MHLQCFPANFRIIENFNAMKIWSEGLSRAAQNCAVEERISMMKLRCSVLLDGYGRSETPSGKSTLGILNQE